MAQIGLKAQTARIQIVAPRETLNFLDIQSADLSQPTDPLEIYRMMSGPMRKLNWAFKIRDLISQLFGVKPILGFSETVPASVNKGDMLDFFLVEGSGREDLVLTARDRHLDVMTCLSTTDQQVTITSSVVTHNLFGRMYMVVVGPAHRVIVRRLLKKLSL